MTEAVGSRALDEVPKPEREQRRVFAAVWLWLLDDGSVVRMGREPLGGLRGEDRVIGTRLIESVEVVEGEWSDPVTGARYSTWKGGS